MTRRTVAPNADGEQLAEVLILAEFRHDADHDHYPRPLEPPRVTTADEARTWLRVLRAEIAADRLEVV